MLDTTRPEREVPTSGVSFRNSLYWRPNWWNGFSCRPSFVTLHNGRFMVVDDKDDIRLDIALSDIKDTRFNSFVMNIETNDGEHHVLIYDGAKLSPLPKRRQWEAMKEQELLRNNHDALDQLNIQYMPRAYDHKGELRPQFSYGKDNVLIWGYIFYALGVPVSKHPVLKLVGISS